MAALGARTHTYMYSRWLKVRDNRHWLSRPPSALPSLRRRFGYAQAEATPTLGRTAARELGRRRLRLPKKKEIKKRVTTVTAHSVS